MSEVMELANSGMLWAIASVIVGIVFFQAFKFMSLASKASGSVGMTKKDVRAAVRTGAISSIGPSFAIVIIAISLISLIGNPVALIRIGIIGSAPIETVGATLGAQAAGSELGTDSFTKQAFTAAVWVMCLGGMGWLIFTALFTKSLGKIQKKASSTPKRMSLFKVVSTGAMIGAFGYLGTSQMIVGLGASAVLLVSAVSMPIIMAIAKKYNMSWMKEWSLGLVVLIGLILGYFLG
ncbi:MAG TPA: DUF5058 family protein [Bacillota bacterium]|nr:DUF5058 family protein [Bacillota bacterium]